MPNVIANISTRVNLVLVQYTRCIRCILCIIKASRKSSRAYLFKRPSTHFSPVTFSRPPESGRRGKRETEQQHYVLVHTRTCEEELLLPSSDLFPSIPLLLRHGAVAPKHTDFLPSWPFRRKSAIFFSQQHQHCCRRLHRWFLQNTAET